MLFLSLLVARRSDTARHGIKILLDNMESHIQDVHDTMVAPGVLVSVSSGGGLCTYYDFI